MKGYAAFVIAQRKLIVGLISFVTLFFIFNLFDLRVNPSPYFMKQEHESRIHELDIKSLFTNSGEQILVAFKPHQGSPLDLATIQVIKVLTEKFEALTLNELIDELLVSKLRFSPEASSLVDQLLAASQHERASLLRQLTEAAKTDRKDASELKNLIAKVTYLYEPIAKVRSFSTIENLTSTDDELDLHPLLPEGKLDTDTLSSFKAEALDNPLFRELLISNDTMVTTIQIEISIPKDDNRSTGKLYNKVVEIVEQTEYQGDIYLAGNPVIDAQMAKSMERDNVVFFPFVMLVISLILYLGFRSWAGIYVPLTIAAVTTIWTLGLMVTLGMEQNIVTTILPVFLLTVAVADAIHFYNYFISKDLQNGTVTERLNQTFSSLTRPLLLTSITTLCGFLALAWTDITFIYEFGILMAAGVIFAFIITMLLAPILVMNIDIQKNTNRKRVANFFEAKLVGLVSIVIAQPLKIFVLMLVCLLGSVYCLQYLKFDQEGINNFAPSTTLRSHNTAMLKHFNGTIPIDIWIDTGKQGGIYNPDIIKDIQKIEAYLKSRDDIGFVLSPVDFLERMYDLLTYEGHKLPENFSEQLVAQEILVYENERSQDIKHVIDDQHRHARLIVLGKSDAASFWEPILKDIEALSPASTRLEINGYGKVMFTNIEEVIKTNISSTLIALVFISSLMALLFKSIQLGVIGILPLVLTVLMNYAIMALLGVAVDVGTTIVASIAFGIGIDYSIHFLSCIEKQSQDGERDLIKILTHATRTVGLPIAINSLTLAGGFLVLATSNFLVLQLLGLFISMTMLISALNALILIPLVYFLWHRKAKRYAVNI
jgi:hypothetical protein